MCVCVEKSMENNTHTLPFDLEEGVEFPEAEEAVVVVVEVRPVPPVPPPPVLLPLLLALLLGATVGEEQEGMDGRGKEEQEELTTTENSEHVQNK